MIPPFEKGPKSQQWKGGKLLSSCNLFFLKWKVCYQHLERKVSKSWSLDSKINFINFSQKAYIHTAHCKSHIYIYESLDLHPIYLVSEVSLKYDTSSIYNWLFENMSNWRFFSLIWTILYSRQMYTGINGINVGPRRFFYWVCLKEWIRFQLYL